ncbi:MAG: PTS sugar transporter subunit IIC [Gemmatimonadota bacterium]
MPVPEIVAGPGEWLALVLLGALTALDSVSWPQAMISRPLVAATLAGWIMGSPAAGFLCGAALELMDMLHAPYGAARYPEPGPASVVAGSAYAAAGATTVGPLAAALLLGWALAQVGGWSVQLQRRVNEHLLPDRTNLASRPREIEARHVLAMLVDGVRGALLVGSFTVPAMLITGLSTLGEWEPAQTAYAITAIVLTVAVASGAAARRAAHGVQGWPYFMGGALLGLVLLWLGIGP